MQIATVSYRETRSFGNYQNITIEAHAAVGPSEIPEECLSGLKSWVQAQLQEKIAYHQDQQEDDRRRWDKSAELRELEAKITEAENKWNAITAFMTRFGITDFGEVPF